MKCTKLVLMPEIEQVILLFSVLKEKREITGLWIIKYVLRLSNFLINLYSSESAESHKVPWLLNTFILPLLPHLPLHSTQTYKS